MNRGDIYLVNLDPTIGHEIKKSRPCVLVGATPINQARHTVIVVPLSSKTHVYPPITIPIICQGVQGIAVCDQIRTVDKSRLIKPMGQLSANDLDKLENSLRQVLVL